jgi:hypothetical protein
MLNILTIQAALSVFCFFIDKITVFIQKTEFLFNY